MADQGHSVDPLDAAFNVDPEVQPAEGQGQPVDESSAVQPEGQGQQDVTSGLYDLDSITDPAIREHVERVAKDIDRNVNAKFQEHAEFRKSWEPYQGIKLTEDGEPLNILDYDPQGVGYLLDFANRLGEGGDTARAAIQDLAESLKIDLGQAPPADPAASDDDPDRPLTRAEFLEWQEGQRQAEEDARELARLEAENIAAYRAEYAEVEKANGKPFSDAEKARLIQLAKRFNADTDEPIKAAWEFINSIAGEAETALVTRQPAAPAAAERGGRASTATEPVTDFDEAERLHKVRNRVPSH